MRKLFTILTIVAAVIVVTYTASLVYAANCVLVGYDSRGKPI